MHTGMIAQKSLAVLQANLAIAIASYAGPQWDSSIV